MNRKNADQDSHEAKTRLTQARASALELETDVRGTMDAPLPGEASVRFEEMSNIFRFVLRNLNQEFAAEVAKKAAKAFNMELFPPWDRTSNDTREH